jgi:hypothetical protein
MCRGQPGGEGEKNQVGENSDIAANKAALRLAIPACPHRLGVRKSHDRVSTMGPIAMKARIADGSHLKRVKPYFSNIIIFASLFAPCCKT